MIKVKSLGYFVSSPENKHEKYYIKYFPFLLSLSSQIQVAFSCGQLRFGTVGK